MRRLYTKPGLLAITGMAIVAFLLVGCGQQNNAASSSQQDAASLSGPALHLIFGAYRTEFNTPASMCTVPLIVEGHIANYKAGHWNTTSGVRPQSLTAVQAQQQGYMIYTPIQPGTFNTLLDRRSGPTHEFVVLGGQVGQDTYALEDYPQPPSNKRFLMLFLPSNHAGQPGYFQDSLVLYDAFPIDSQGNVLLQQQSIEQGQTYGQNVSIPLTTLASDLAGCTKK
jgi:hypothetical protein